VIMNDLGEEKAGDGGAVNQLSRQVGGALGVAIVGSVFAGVYGNQIDEKLTELPPEQRDRATESIEEARDVVEGVRPALRDQLTARVDDAFDLAARVGFGTCVAVLLLAAAFAAASLSGDRSYRRTRSSSASA
jgi:MFS transporter, DHA2 family, multidrug resistance protein